MELQTCDTDICCRWRVCQYLNLIDRNYEGCGPLHPKEAERRGELCAATEVLVGVALFFFD